MPPFPANRADIMNAAIAVLRAQGATSRLIAALAAQLPAAHRTCFRRLTLAPAGCSTALFYGFKRDLNAYLASLGPGAPVHSLAE